MGLIRFKVHDSQPISQEKAERAYMSGHDRVPWPSETYWTGEMVVMKRPVEDSGNFYIPWYVEGFGELILGTATLRQREAPYNLHVELARGKINQVRNQTYDWQSIGLHVPDRLTERIKSAVTLFSKAATNQHDPEVCVEAADQALVIALEATELLASCFADQALAARHRQDQQLGTLLGANFGDHLVDDFTARQFRNSFNSVIIPFNWRQIESQEGQYDWAIPDKQVEWGETNGLTIWGGPLVFLSESGLPDWLLQWKDDFSTLMTFVSDYIETTVARFRDRINLWECAAKTNVSQALGLNEEQRLRLTVRAIETVRRVDPNAEYLITVDQPWAEYMKNNEWELSPIHFADALARAELGLSGVNLQINVGYLPGGSPQRDLLELSRLLDLWGFLGLPLYISLTFPTSDAEDPNAYGKDKPIPNGMHEGWSPISQRAWVEKVIPLILAKRNVYGIFWNQLSDGQPHEYPHGGLFNSEGRPKPALATLATMRKYHLK
ncbi:Glycoside hydrolase [Planctomycetales bacterium 10988]|nr:Glycoside hydrolase [Planctomycetales bacterium 10988]